jgi:Holliday junction resolvase RusA-like endonuclease
LKIIVPYFGDLSCNAYKVFRKGKPVITTKPNVKVWMAKLADEVEYRQRIEPISLEGKVVIGLVGHFKDLNNTPDLSNLHKVLDDAIKVGLNYDDREFLHSDLGYNTGNIEPTLEITISATEANLK